MAKLNVSLLKKLCEASGIPGREDQLRAIVIDELKPLVDELSVDVMGNVVGTKRGNGGPRVMIAAHMDEIGFLVKHIDDNGFIRLQPVGGFDARVLVAQRVLVHGFNGKVYRGAVQAAAKPIHLLEPGDIKPSKLEELFVDIGLPVDEVKAAVEVGDMVTLDRTLEEVGQCVMSKSLDDRVGVYVMLEAVRSLKSIDAEIVAVATTQEEVGLRGARTAAFALEPDISVALDVTLALDIPGAGSELAVSRIGKGPAIKIFDSSHLTHPKLVRHIRDIAGQKGIPYQLEILPKGGTDAGAMQLSRAGSAAVTLSIPCRYVHTVNEMANIEDINGTVDLLAAYLEEAGVREYSYEVN